MGVGLAGATFVGLARVGYHALHIGTAPRFFDIIGKFIVGHFADNQITFDQITGALENAYVLFNVYVAKFPALATLTPGEKG
jgi:hypothetical protein